MTTTVDEVADGVYRVATFVPEVGRAASPSTSSC